MLSRSGTCYAAITGLATGLLASRHVLNQSIDSFRASNACSTFSKVDRSQVFSLSPFKFFACLTAGSVIVLGSVLASNFSSSGINAFATVNASVVFALKHAAVSIAQEMRSDEMAGSLYSLYSAASVMDFSRGCSMCKECNSRRAAGRCVRSKPYFEWSPKTLRARVGQRSSSHLPIDDRGRRDTVSFKKHGCGV